MSDPFFSLNANNLQTISATNSRLQDMNASMAKPLMAPHPPQLPQQTKPMTVDDRGLTDRQKFEKQRKFQMQQKRLQEMSFSKAVPTHSSSSSADLLMANLIQKVESDAKFDKRLNQRVYAQNYQQSIPQPSVTSSLAHITNPMQLGGTSYGHQVITSVQTPQTSGYFNSYYPSYQSTHPSVHQTPNPSLNSVNTSSTSVTSVASYGPPVDNCQYIPTVSSSTSALAYNSAISNKSSDPIFAITTTNGFGSGVTHINTDPIPLTAKPPIVQKLPHCFDDVFKLPTLYIKVWNYVKVDEMSIYCDTNKLYPVLLSVGLPQPTLAQLWSVVNQTIPGQLTRHELNMALALIALLQRGCAKPLEEIYALDSLPIPTIQFFADPIDQKPSFPEVLRISNDNHKASEMSFNHKTVNSQNIQNREKNISHMSYESNKEQNPVNNLSPNEENDDDFDDFKSADFSSIEESNFKTTYNSEMVSNGIIQSISNEDEFDDFKSADLSEESNNSLSVCDQNQKKSHSLSDALMSNITAFTPINTNSQRIVFNPINKTTNSSQITIAETTEKTLNSNSSSTDKYSVFRELSGCEATKSVEFGDFSSVDINCDAESVDSLKIRHQDVCDTDTIESISQQIIQTSRQIIHKAFNILIVNHGQESVIEAMRSSEGRKFALDLSEVYAIVKRVTKSLESTNKSNKSLMILVEDIDNTWKSIKSVFTKASIDIQSKDETRLESTQTCSQCAICCWKASDDRPVLSFAGFEYHTSCANLWLNCINPTLPQPLINCR